MRTAAPFHLLYDAGVRAEGRVHGALRAGRVLDDEFLAYAPGPMRLPLDQVRDLRILDETHAQAVQGRLGL